MCTLTWWPAPDGYDLFFNRDELDTRAPELPPREQCLQGVRLLAPADGNHGGTWLAVNEYGLTVALLNDYGAAWRPPTHRRSRGALVLACAPANSLQRVEAVVRASGLAETGAFHLVAIDGMATPLVLHWNGERLSAQRGAEVEGFYSSSSFRTAEVIEHRRRLYGVLTQTGAARRLAEAEAYHHFHDASNGAFSVRMLRPDAATRSITHVSVSKDSVDLRYEPQAWLVGDGAGRQRYSLPRAYVRPRTGARE